MSATTPQLPQAIRVIAPWISATAALLMAVVILSQFIDTLHVSIRRGEALRSSIQAHNSPAPHVSTYLADSGKHSQSGDR